MSTKRKHLTRRTLIAGAGLAGCCVLGGAAAVVRVVLDSDPTSNVGRLAFRTPLAIPPPFDGEIDDRGRRVFDLTLQTGSARIVPFGGAGETTTWGINGPLLGPTLRARRGDVVAPAVHNELPEDTTLHWHGMHLPAAMDGGPHQKIATGESWYPEWTVENPASTLWYHPHPHGKTAEHVYKGVAGLFLIDDDERDRLGLPREYGVDDIPLIIQDRLFDEQGELEFRETSAIGLFGDTILINGTFDPHLAITRSPTRFRILNGSNTRFYNLGFTDDRMFRLVATDNGFVPGEPVELTRLLVGPGERAEIVAAFAPGEQVILRSHPHDLEQNTFNFGNVGEDDTFDIIRLVAEAELVESAPLPDRLVDEGGIPDIPDGTTSRTFRLGGNSLINSRGMDMTRIDEVVPAGALEVWDVESNGQPHTFHIHGVTFHVLDVNGEEPPPELRGPKDTVFVSNGHSVRLAVRFGQHTDPDTPYMFHCHLLRHEDNGMMGQFVVVEPGTEDSVPLTIQNHAHHE